MITFTWEFRGNGVIAEITESQLMASHIIGRNWPIYIADLQQRDYVEALCLLHGKPKIFTAVKARNEFEVKVYGLPSID